jgi:hypothetical protein
MRAFAPITKGRSDERRRNGKVGEDGHERGRFRNASYARNGHSNPISVQGQFAFLRNLHYAARHARNVIIAGVLGSARERRHLCVLDWLQGECRGAVQRFRAGRLPANSVEAEKLEERDPTALGKRARG